MGKIVLNGITWGHSRGITPLFATAQRFSELNPDIEINWKKRTLQEFADYPLEKLTKEYDLLIIDHPWVGCAAATKCVLPLDEYLSKKYLDDQLKNSVGYSHLSYYYSGHQWALAIDAAAPVASYRPDLLEKNDSTVPHTWAEVISLARRGKLAVPSIPIDLLMHFYMFCGAHGNDPFLTEEEVIDSETGLKALDSMKDLWSLVNKRMFDCNPIAIAELMTLTDDYWYCPFAYGYSNYSRRGYARCLLKYTSLACFESSHHFRSTLGGTGLAVSSVSLNKEWAIRFGEWMVSPEVQSGLYAQNGGQPGHRSAWLDEEVNKCCNDYFRNTLSTVDQAFVRPRYNGYLLFQDEAGISLQKYLLQGGRSKKVLEEINQCYRDSKRRTRTV
ncbi:MAG: extracellular solute-binding protein [Bacteroidota bacterium]|nr:extracellular solute-binding protein [Bacteroidota bacterium]